MPESAPFQINDIVVKDVLEGNRHTGSFRIDQVSSEDEASALLRAKNPPDNYIAIRAELITGKKYTAVQIITDPDVTDTGTEVASFNRRSDAPPADSTLYTSPTYTSGTGTAGGESPLHITESQDQRKIPLFIVPHDTDVIIQLIGDKKTFGMDVEWSEVSKSIVPKIN